MAADMEEKAGEGQENAPSGVEGPLGKVEEKHDDVDGKDKEAGPEGGFDSTPIPNPPSGAPGYTLKITMHRATSLAIGDAVALSSDPYVLAQMNTDVATRHKEDPKLRFRTPTVRKNTDPEWNEEWVVANVPASGFTLKLRVYDEDPADHDDMLGKVHVKVDSLSEGWPGIKNQSYRLLMRDSSKRALLLRAAANCFGITKHLRGEIYLSIEMLGRTEPDDQNGRLYTAGYCRWIRHHSPMLGRIAHIKEPSQDQAPNANGTPQQSKKKQAQRYNFQANQMQLQGPVPAKLYHRFVEFRPWVKRMFTTSGFQGVLLGKALHHQHARVYNFGRSTVWGHFPQGPCKEMTQQFLDLVHYDEGGRIFTYVLTLDALWRFTETGKEFGIDMLSKHTMHSDVSIYIAFSGEFFIRRLKHSQRPPPPAPVEGTSQQHPPDHGPNKEHPPQDVEGGPPDADPPKDPSYYQLVIDNDSGTYRPNAAMLPLLADFLARSLPGLHIMTLDCQADADKMGKMKAEQRDRKKREGQGIVYTQGSRSSSISSSDEEDLDAVEAAVGGGEQDIAHGDGGAREHGATRMAARDVKLRNKSKMEKARRNYGSVRRPSGGGREDGGDGEEVGQVNGQGTG